MLATNSIASVNSLDMRDEVAAACKLHGNRVDKKTIERLARQTERLENPYLLPVKEKGKKVAQKNHMPSRDISW